MKRVFLSYSRRDAAIADNIRAVIENLGHKALDAAQNLTSGREWRKEVGKEIRDADLVIAIISSAYANTSSWMGYEIGAAEALHKPILTLASDRISPEDLPSDLISRQVILFDPDSPERAAREVAERLAAA